MKSLMALLLVLATPVLAVEQAEDFAWQATLQTPATGPWFQLDLPLPALLAAKHNDLRDLRVQNAQGQFLAYSLLQPAAEYRQAEQSHGVRWFPLRPSRPAPACRRGCASRAPARARWSRFSQRRRQAVSCCRVRAGCWMPAPFRRPWCA